MFLYSKSLPNLQNCVLWDPISQFNKKSKFSLNIFLVVSSNCTFSTLYCRFHLKPGSNSTSDTYTSGTE